MRQEMDIKLAEVHKSTIFAKLKGVSFTVTSKQLLVTKVDDGGFNPR